MKEENSQPPNEYRSIELKNPDDFNLIQGEIKKNSKTITPSITTREKTTISLNKNNIEKKRENNNFFIKKSSFLNTFKSCQIKNEEDLKIMNNFQYKTSNEMLNDFSFLGKDLASMNAGSAVPSMTTEILNSMPVVIPQNSIVNEFDNVISSYFRKIENNDNESRRLAELRDTLLPKLMSGELKVNDIH